jgi:hypothetical protein
LYKHFYCNSWFYKIKEKNNDLLNSRLNWENVRISCVEPSFCAVVYGVPQRRSANSVRHLMIHSTSSGQDVSECLGYDTGPFKHKRQLSSTVNKQHFARQIWLTLSFIIFPLLFSCGNLSIPPISQLHLVRI